MSDAIKCPNCGSEELCFGVDEHDVEDGTYVCEDCEHEGRVTVDGTTIDAVQNTRGFYDVRANGVTFAHAMIDVTALITADEAVKCWNATRGQFTYAGENAFPQYVDAMISAFPQHADAIRSTVA